MPRSSLAIRTFALDEACRNARTIAELDSHFGGFVADLELGSWRALLIAQGGLRKLVFASGRPPTGWSQHYLEHGLAEHDAVIGLVQRTSAPVVWSRIASSSLLTREAQRVFSDARAFGLVDGVCTPVRLADGELWIVATFSTQPISPGDEILFAWESGVRSYLRRLRLMLTSTELRQKPGRLTKRQREVLARLAEGARQTEIADELGVTVKAIEATLADARSRFNAPTTIRLVMDAVALGEIDSPWIDIESPWEIPRARPRGPA